MKKQIPRFSLAILLCTILFSALLPMTPSAYASPAEPAAETAPSTEPSTEPESQLPDNSVGIQAPDGLRAGETVTFSFLCNGENIRALQGSLTYNTTLLTYVKSTTVPEDWKITFSEESGTLSYLGLSTESRGLTGENTLFTITFRVAEGAEVGNGVAFTLSSATAYNGEKELSFAGGDFTYAITRPLSEERTLTALSVEGGNLRPAFSPEITEYAVTLPHSAETAEIKATPCTYASLEIGNQSLSVGENTVTVTVISESGLQQVYTLKITRAADPNYVPSSDCRILSLSLSDGLLFPAFSPEITQYSVYVVKGETVTIIPTSADKAGAAPLSLRSTSDGAVSTMVCTAEDGSTRTYTFRTILLDTPEELAKLREQEDGEKDRLVLYILLLIVAAVTLFFLGFVFSNLIHGRRKKQTAAFVPADTAPASAPEPITAAPVAIAGEDTADKAANSPEEKSPEEKSPEPDSPAGKSPAPNAQKSKTSSGNNRHNGKKKSGSHKKKKHR